jgi:hypothetical protein
MPPIEAAYAPRVRFSAFSHFLPLLHFLRVAEIRVRLRPILPPAVVAEEKAEGVAEEAAMYRSP